MSNTVNICVVYLQQVDGDEELILNMCSCKDYLYTAVHENRLFSCILCFCPLENCTYNLYQYVACFSNCPVLSDLNVFFCETLMMSECSAVNLQN